MSVQIVTGYTGERHITPYMDATINRGIFGDDDSFLSTGGQMAASMPDINTFVISDGAFSIQGHVGITNGETLTVDTCATGSRRIDLVVARYEHDTNTNTNIDTMSIVLLKGEETTSQYPTTPTYRTGVIAEGANVDMPLYKITLNGSTVNFSRVRYVKFPELEWGHANLARNVSDEADKDVGFEAIRSDTGVGLSVAVGSGGINHGIWSNTNNHWMIYEDNNGVCRISSNDLRVGGHSSSIGSIVQAYNSSSKTCKSGTWYALCSVVLDAGVWLVTAGARWDPDTAHNPPWTGQRIANLSTTSGDKSYGVCVAATDNRSITQVRWSEVVTMTARNRVYLNVAHGAGVNLVMPASGNNWGSFIRAVCIK